MPKQSFALGRAKGTREEREETARHNGTAQRPALLPVAMKLIPEAQDLVEVYQARIFGSPRQMIPSVLPLVWPCEAQNDMAEGILGGVTSEKEILCRDGSQRQSVAWLAVSLGVPEDLCSSSSEDITPTPARTHFSRVQLSFNIHSEGLTQEHRPSQGPQANIQTQTTQGVLVLVAGEAANPEGYTGALGREHSAREQWTLAGSSEWRCYDQETDA